MRLTSYIPALDMLTLPLVSLSKPVGPFNELGTLKRTVNELNHAKGVISLPYLYINERFLLNPALAGSYSLIFFINERFLQKGLRS